MFLPSLPTYHEMQAPRHRTPVGDSSVGYNAAIMKHVLILAVVLIASLTVGQDVQHAPTVAQCRADQRLWLSEMEENDDSPKLPTFGVLSKRNREMEDCKKIDPDNHSKYFNTASEIHPILLMRLMDYLDRHGLRAQFQAEDAAGKR
jgi:hypothetical protein